MTQSMPNFTPEAAPAASEAAASAIPDNLLAEAGALADKLAEWRHELHQIPELSNDTPQTSAFIQARLAELGIPFRTLVDGNCVVGLVGL